MPSKREKRILLLNPTQAKAFLEEQCKAAGVERHIVRKEALLAALAASDDGTSGNSSESDMNKDMSEYIKAMNVMTMHAAMMEQAPDVGGELGQLVPNLQPHLDTAKHNAVEWRSKLRPKLSKVATDVVDSANVWEASVDYMMGEANKAKEEQQNHPADKEKILAALKSNVSEAYFFLKDDTGDKRARISDCVLDLSNMLANLNTDAKNFTTDGQEVTTLLGTKSDPGLLSAMDDAIAAQRKRIDTDIGLIAGGVVAAVVAIGAAIAIVVVTGGIGIGAGLALGAVGVAGAGAAIYGGVDLPKAYDDLAAAVSNKSKFEQDAFVLKSNQSTITAWQQSAASAASALMVIQSTWDSLGNLLDNFRKNIDKANDANSVIAAVLSLMTAKKSLTDVKQFTLDNIISSVGTISYEEAKALQEKSASATLKLSMMAAAATTPTVASAAADDTPPRPAYNLFKPNFDAEQVEPFVTQSVMALSVALTVAQQQRIYSTSVQKFSEHQQKQAQNAEEIFGVVSARMRSVFSGLENFCNSYASASALVEEDLSVLPDVASFLLAELDDVRGIFENLDTSHLAPLINGQQGTIDAIELDLIQAQGLLRGPAGKAAALVDNLASLRSQIDNVNRDIATTGLKYGLTKFVDDLSGAMGLAFLSYSTSRTPPAGPGAPAPPAGDWGASQSWDYKKQAIGKLSSLGSTAKDMPDLSRKSADAMELLRQYGQNLTASMLLDQHFSTIASANELGGSLLLLMGRLQTSAQNFKAKLDNLRQQLETAFAAPADEQTRDKLLAASPEWERTKSLMGASNRMSVPSVTATINIELTRDEIVEKFKGAQPPSSASAGSDSASSASAPSPLMMAAEPIPAAGLDDTFNATAAAARNQAADIAGFCKRFQEAPAPASNEAAQAALNSFVEGLRGKRTTMQATEAQLTDLTGKLNVSVSQIATEQLNLKAKIDGDTKVLSQLQNELKQQQQDLRTRRMWEDAFAWFLGISKLIGLIIDAIEQTQAKIEQTETHLSKVKQEADALRNRSGALEQQAKTAGENAHKALLLSNRLEVTIDLVSNAIRDNPIGILAIAYKVAVKGAADIFAMASTF